MIQEEKSKDARSGEENKPHLLEKLVNGVSGEVKLGEDRRAVESTMASKESVPKAESVAKSEEGKLSFDEKVKYSLEEKMRKEDNIDKTGKIGEKEKNQKQEKKSGSVWEMSILIAINLLDYIDKFTLAGVLSDVQAFYNIRDAQGGLLQTVYIVCAMIISPVWGYFGDRYNRKYLMTSCLLLWTCTVLLSTFIPNNMFWLFACTRGVIAFGQTCYTTVAPSVIADLYVGGSRSRMLMLFYSAIPCGSGLGFIIGGSVAAMAGHWTWGVGITFIPGIACAALMILFLKEPERGAAEKEQGGTSKKFAATSLCEDLRSLSTNLTYIFVTAAYTAIVFTAGTLSWWTVVAIVHNDAHKMGLNHTHLLPTKRKDRISLIFGAITCVSGIVGVALGSVLSMLLRNGIGPFKCVKTVRSDPIISGAGAFLAAPFLHLCLTFIPINMVTAWICMFITITAASFNWAIIVNMMMDIIIPPRRNVAIAWQIMISHAFGDASGPYIIGLISDAVRGDETSPGANFKSLVASFHIPNVLLLLSAILFFCSAYTFVKDNNEFKKIMGALDGVSIPKESDVSIPDAKQLAAEMERLGSTQSSHD